MNFMHKPPHPGEVLMGLYMDPAGINITEMSTRLGVERKAVSRLVNGHTSVSPAMALRLSRALNTSPQVWFKLQFAYDLWKTNQDEDFADSIDEIRPFKRLANA
jgi:addiction module HigA family antidote